MIANRRYRTPAVLAVFLSEVIRSFIAIVYKVVGNEFSVSI